MSAPIVECGYVEVRNLRIYIQNWPKSAKSSKTSKTKIQEISQHTDFTYPTMYKAASITVWPESTVQKYSCETIM